MAGAYGEAKAMDDDATGVFDSIKDDEKVKALGTVTFVNYNLLQTI